MIKSVASPSFKAYFVNNENLRELYYRNNEPNNFNIGYFKKTCPNHKIEVISLSRPDSDGNTFVNLYNHNTDRFTYIMTDKKTELDDVLLGLNKKHIQKDEFWQKKPPRKNILKILTNKN